jgi:signal transduction histidine kinase
VRDRTDALQKAQVQLVQQEKLSTLGELIAGIAHEMNNPISFITNNIPPLQEYFDAITELLQLYEQAYPTPPAKITNFIRNLDLKFVLEDIVKILSSLQVGSERIQHLSTSLRSFSRSDSDTKLAADLHLGIDSTLMILQHRLKANGDRPGIEVMRCYGKLPHVNCYVGEMNQVFMNLLANAIDALDEAITQGKMCDRIPQIHITTDVNSQQMVVIQIADNGIGIPERLKQRLFEPLFTTKPVGKGTGLGLSIAHQIIVEKHNGTMEVHSQPGIGTEFAIAIPI